MQKKTIFNLPRNKGKLVDKGMRSSQLMELFQEQLKHILWAEKALLKAIPALISMVASQELIDALTDHLSETREHINRLEKVFQIIGEKPSAVLCDAMEGLIIEAIDIVDNCEKGPKRDAGIISNAQKIEHYEIATYGTMREFAETLGIRDANLLLQQTLNEEKAADKALTNIAVKLVNMNAAVNQTQNILKRT